MDLRVRVGSAYNITVWAYHCQGHDDGGLHVRTPPTRPDGMVIRVESEGHFLAEDRDAPDFYIDGKLTDGVLNFKVVESRGGRRRQFAGRGFFDAMMHHFGNRVQVIAAVWSDARPEFSTNLDIFDAETARNVSKMDAAFATKTGTWARDYGFTSIRRINTTPDDFPGGYEQVLVEFVKPSKRKRARKGT